MFIRRRKYAELIEACTFVSLVCLIIVATSLSTQEWTYATASVVDNGEDVKDSTVNHGLFAGTLVRRILDSPKSYDIHCKNSNHEFQFIINFLQIYRH